MSSEVPLLVSNSRCNDAGFLSCSRPSVACRGSHVNFSDRNTKIALSRWISLAYGRQMTALAKAEGEETYCGGIWLTRRVALSINEKLTPSTLIALAGKTYLRCQTFRREGLVIHLRTRLLQLFVLVAQ